jgi:hypothetical protein
MKTKSRNVRNILILAYFEIPFHDFLFLFAGWGEIEKHYKMSRSGEPPSEPIFFDYKSEVPTAATLYWVKPF